MAGTRRRSRISNASAAAQHPRSASRTTSVADEAADVEHAHANIVEVAESVDNGSPRPQTPVNRSTKGFCRNCNTPVGEFYNAFTKITGAYYLPAMLGSYKSHLQERGGRKTAIGEELNGCTIQPLACPGRCKADLAFNVVDAPGGKHAFRGRDFFKLPLIELRCGEPPDAVTVEPQVVDVSESLAVDESDHSSPVPVIIPPAGDMEVDTRPPPPPSGPPHSRHDQSYHHHHHHHHHQPLQQVEANRQSLPPPSSIRSPSAPLQVHVIPQKSPSNPPLPSPAVKPVHELQYAQPPSKESAGLVNRTRDLPPVMSHSHSPAEPHRTNGQYYPRSPQDVQLDAIERLQTQISQNSSALVAQSRDMRRYEETLQHGEETLRREFQTQFHHQAVEIRRVDEAVGRLEHEMRGIRELLEALTREVQATGEMRSRGVTVAPGQPISAQDSALELMAQQVAVISHKANEVDTLKITIEIMKNKIQRLEDAASATPAPQVSAHPYASPREPSAHSIQSSHAVPSYHSTPSAVPHINTPVHPAHRLQSFHSHGSQSVVATPEMSQRAEPVQTPSGWVTVNAGTKRTHQNGVDSPHDSVGQPIGSPKRPKLAPIEPRVAYSSSQSHPQHVYDHVDTDDSDGRIQAHPHTLPSQTQSTGSVPESTLPSQPQHPAFVPYTTQDAPSDDSWRPESQRISEVRTPRGRGRGGGPGSRGGRVRKSMAAQIHPIATPEWERDDWQGVPDSQISPDGYYSHMVRSGRGIVRRGSGGRGRGGANATRPSSSSSRAVSLGLQGVTAGVALGLPADPYAHTKKTRTKPIRNADGVLIRKDGRPDMRSQSSAANLRKVHARKEEQRGGSERGFTPTGTQHGSIGAESPSPTGHHPTGQDVTASVQKKHNEIMDRMFPSGIDEARKEHDYARKVFEEDQDHTAHPRAQHHHHHSQHEASAHPLEIKREQFESRLADAQSPNSGDIDMDRPEDHADDEGQTPGGQTDNSGRESQYHDATSHEDQQAQQAQQAQHGAQENTGQAQPSTLESSHTLAASSAQAS